MYSFFAFTVQLSAVVHAFQAIAVSGYLAICLGVDWSFSF